MRVGGHTEMHERMRWSIHYEPEILSMLSCCLHSSALERLGEFFGGGVFEYNHIIGLHRRDRFSSDTVVQASNYSSNLSNLWHFARLYMNIDARGGGGSISVWRGGMHERAVH